jgi:carboxymethylenebutenolidase
MCHSDDSRPPAPPEPGEIEVPGAITLRSADGSPLLAHVARPVGASRGRIVILPDVRGLHPYYRDLAARFAEAGFDTVAIDYFGRTVGEGERGDDFDWQALIAGVDPADVASDVTTAAAHLAELGATGPVFTVGFCFGGSQSWRLSASDVDLAGVIGFYGQPARVRDVLDRLHRPMLLLIAGADMTPAEEFVTFQAELETAGVPFEAHTYPGAPHSFFDRAFAEWSDTCDDAWRQILDFTARQSVSV